MGKRETITAEKFISAIPGTAGIISTIAKKVGCEWHAAKKYIDKYPSIRQAYDDECNSVLDLAEVGLIKLIQSGELSAIKYYLSTKGKHRGYVERVEQTGADGGPVEIKYIEVIMPPEEPSA